MSSLLTVSALLLYVINVFFCVRAIKQRDSNVYKITKPLLMPFLALCFICLLPDRALSETTNRLILIALFFHTAGDILLLFPKSMGKMYFYCGMLGFFTGHFFYVASFLTNGISCSKALAVTTLLIMFVLEYFFYRQLVLGSRRHAPMFLPYTFGLAALIIVITSQITLNPRWYAPVISLLGTGLFVFSDYCIARREMRMPIAGQMVVMPTYIAGQTLIIAGTLLTQI